MKMKTIEEKAKRYDEALIRGSKLWESDMITRENYEYIFPEVKESENIKIIKAIKYGLDHVFTNNTTVFEVTKEQCLSWFEKQGEQKPIIIDIDKMVDEFAHTEVKGYGMPAMIEVDAYRKGVNDVLCLSLNLEKQDEQKPAWSEEDEKVIHCLEYTIKHFYEDEDTIKWCCDWLKSLKDRVQPQPNQEWSEEDDHNLQCCIDKIQYDIDNGRIGRNRELLAWLKSLKEIYTWKPSDEQMKAFDAVLVYNPPCSNECRNHLITLYNDLEKLK